MKKNILICDDSIISRKKIIDILDKYDNCEFYEAKNGQEAIEMYKSIKPDIVFMDITMPVKTGIEAIKEIKIFDNDAKIVLASSTITQKHLSEAIDAGAIEFVQKPFSDKQIQKIFVKVVEGGE